MKPYLDLLDNVLANGKDHPDRTGVGRRSIFGTQVRFDLAAGFPLVTTKKIFVKGIIHELLWFISGNTNIKYLTDNGVHIWDEWADKNGNLGPVYGRQWRMWDDPERGRLHDQLGNVIEILRDDPDSSRAIVSAWNVADLIDMALPPCHVLYQFYAADGRLSCQVYQRSADILLGVPFNIASYALLTLMVAQCVKLPVGDLVWTGGDTHLYANHFEQARLQLSRAPRALPTMRINPAVHGIDDFRHDDFTLIGYDPHPPIWADVAV